MYDVRDRDDLDPLTVVRDLDLPWGEEREVLVDRDRVYELNGEDSRTTGGHGGFRVVPEHDLDADTRASRTCRTKAWVQPHAPLGGDRAGSLWRWRLWRRAPSAQ